MIYVQIAESLQSKEGDLLVQTALLENAARQVLVETGSCLDLELTLVLTDDAQLHALNRQFLGVDEPTDVLAFPAGETDPDSHKPYLGDVIISYSHAVAQAAIGGHSIEEELQLLVVHGVLHLLGYDHMQEKEKAAMWAAQKNILIRLGCSVPTSYP